MSKAKITINSKENSVKLNGEEIGDVIADLSVNIHSGSTPTVTLTFVPLDVEINGEIFYAEQFLA